MQYPIRSLHALKDVFPKNEDIVFVSNEKIFKDTLKIYKYEDIFRDQFAGDMGHCTEKGNQIIAANLAEIFAKGIFNKNDK